MRKLTIVVVCLLIGSASVTHALKCGPRLISEGDHKPEVLHKCGDPEFIEEVLFYETVVLDPRTHKQRVHAHSTSARRGESSLQYEIPAGHRLLTQPIRAEDWTYNFEPHRLMHRLRFINGKLKTIRTLGYGY